MRKASRRASSRSASAPNSLLTKLDSMAGQGPGGIIEDATETLAAIRAAADNFNAQVSVLGGGLGDFSDRGLRDLQSLVSRGAADDRPARPGDLEHGAESDRLSSRRGERAGIWRAAAVRIGWGREREGQASSARRRWPRAGVLAALLLAAALAGCASLIAGAPSAIFDLTAPGEPPAAQGSAQVLVPEPTTVARARHRPHRRAADARRNTPICRARSGATGCRSSCRRGWCRRCRTAAARAPSRCRGRGS